jgi:hypothetical protein
VGEKTVSVQIGINLTIVGSQVEGWLCPAMFRYFEEAPAELYMKAEEIP